MKDFNDLKKEIIDTGLCTACGTCAGICPTASVRMADLDGEPAPELAGTCAECGTCGLVCPGKNIPLRDLEQFTFGRLRDITPLDLGVYRYCASGFAHNSDVRFRGASGGMATALLMHALQSGTIDCALLAGFSKNAPWRTEARLATTPAEIAGAAQSKYACVPVNTLLGEALAAGYKKIGVVGLPCHIHALRKIQLHREPAGLADKLSLTIGLLCASQFYFEGTRHLLTEWCKIDDFSVIKEISYRGGGWPGHFVVNLNDGRTVTVDRHKYVYHLLIGIYKRDRCEMCIDWSAELADISVGDYWHPLMKPGEEQGTSSCIIRSEAGDRLFSDAAARGGISSEPLDALTVTASIGFEIKKHGAAFRLAQRKRFGWPAPDYQYLPQWKPFARDTHLAPEGKK